MMDAMNCYVLTSAPEGTAYAELVAFCCSLASKMILVVRDAERSPDPRIEERLMGLQEFRIETRRAREWPGTVLFDHDAMVYWHRVTPSLEAALLSQSSHLFEWVHPAAPEDPCFFRADGSVLLVTTSHEADAYLILSESEFSRLADRAPELLKTLRLEGPVAG
jgi:hypothetical protein